MAAKRSEPGVGAELNQTGIDLLGDRDQLLGVLDQTLLVYDPGLYLAVDGRDALDLLRTHDRAHSVVGRHMAAVSDDGREADQVLTGGTYAKDGAPLADLLGDGLLGLPGIQAQ